MLALVSPSSRACSPRPAALSSASIRVSSSCRLQTSLSAGTPKLQASPTAATSGGSTACIGVPAGSSKKTVITRSGGHGRGLVSQCEDTRLGFSSTWNRPTGAAMADRECCIGLPDIFTFTPASCPSVNISRPRRQGVLGAPDASSPGRSTPASCPSVNRLDHSGCAIATRRRVKANLSLKVEIERLKHLIMEDVESSPGGNTYWQLVPGRARPLMMRAR
jgi:hypothetical protein